MTEPEAFTHNPPTEKAHWSDGEITVLINHMYDHRAESEGGGNFKTSVHNSAADAINGDPILQASRTGPPKTTKMVRSKWSTVRCLRGPLNCFFMFL